MKITVTAFQALCGDCLLVSCQELVDAQPQYIVIDAGYSQTYFRTLSKAVQPILERGEQISLFVLTHTDGDHIGGANSFVDEFGTGVVNQFWMNYAPVDILAEREGPVGIAQGITLRDTLTASKRLNQKPILAGHTQQIKGVKLTILSPDISQYERFLAKWKAQEEAIHARAQPVAAGLYDHHLSVETLIERSFIQDTSWSNRSSIAFLLTAGTFTGLFTGDAHADVLADSLRTAGYTQQNPARLNLLKVAHHGSKGNVNDELLRLIDCQHYLISTNGTNQHRLPHKEALARIVVAAHHRHPEEPIDFYFNYDDPPLQSLFTPQEVDTYKIRCHYPSPYENGVTITYHEQ